VLGCEGGEQLGVTRSSTLGDKLLSRAGDKGGWSGRGLVGVMPGILTGLDINWVGGWEKFSTHSSQLSFQGSVRKYVGLLTGTFSTV
jgi:hypothetical protein